MSKLVPTTIWQDQIERPEEVDAAIDRLGDIIRLLQRKRTNLRSLRRLSVEVYGEPIYDARDDTIEVELPWGTDDDNGRTGAVGAGDAGGPGAVLPPADTGPVDGVQAAGAGTGPHRQRRPRSQAPTPAGSP